MLADGTSIRRKGRRYSQILLDQARAELPKLIKAIEEGYLAFYHPDTEALLTVEELTALVGSPSASEPTKGKIEKAPEDSSKAPEEPSLGTKEPDEGSSPALGKEGSSPEAGEAEAAEGLEETEDGFSRDDLMAMKRPELDTIARECGITSPEKLPTKGAVVDAIFATAAED
jgi:hypothetical protein